MRVRVCILKCFVEQNWFHLIGIICGLAIYNSTVVDLHFPLALYKKLLDVSPTLDDFKELSPTEARSVRDALTANTDPNIKKKKKKRKWKWLKDQLKKLFCY